MQTLLIALGAGIGYLIAYHTYGRWLSRKIFRLNPDAPVPSVALNDNRDYVPTKKSIVFGHHFTSIAGTGPIVGPAIAVMWGWLPALLWVLLGSILIGAVHDFGSLIVSMRNRGQTVGDIAGRVLNKRVRLLFLFILFMALTIVLAIFGLVIAAVFKQFPSAIFPCLIQIPIAVGIGLWLHRQGVNLLVPSLLALAVMYLTVILGNIETGIKVVDLIGSAIGSFNAALAAWPIIAWVAVLLIYSYVASVLPVWTLLQPRDYINSLQLISALALVVVGLLAAALFHGAPPVPEAERASLEIAAPAFRLDPLGAPPILPFLFITIACGACSGFHCLVSSGTSSKQLTCETDAQFVGYGSMLTEGFLATLVILACVAGLSMGFAPKPKGTLIASGSSTPARDPSGKLAIVHPTVNQAQAIFSQRDEARITPLEVQIDAGRVTYLLENQPLRLNKKGNAYLLTPQQKQSLLAGRVAEPGKFDAETSTWFSETSGPIVVQRAAYNTRYYSWSAAGGLGAKVGAFVNGSANFLKAIAIPPGIAVALMGVLVASFAGTTLDTACRLQRYVVQELASTFAPKISATALASEAYDFDDNLEGADRRTGEAADHRPHALNPMVWLTNKHGATIFAIVIAGAIAALPAPGAAWTVASAGKGGLILWPLFGATNQLLAGLALLVISFYLWRRASKVWFVAAPMVFMLIMPGWAMATQIPQWVAAQSINWPVVIIGVATMVLQIWMMVEAIALWPKVRGVVEKGLPPLTMPPIEPQTEGGRSC
ncbi:MAG: carbon starvation protein A [Phycisphaeraceae bacterium]|nr:carbon starvation protein A [Phycisphaeraceae bacterium]